MYSLHLNHQASRCEETWNEKQRKTFSVFTFTLQYCIPVVIITFSYTMIVHDLKFKRHPKTSSTSERYKKRENAKLSRLVFIITVTFALCVLPYHCVALWVEFGDGEQYQYIEDVSIVAFFILYLNSALNPILYNVLSSQFRRECARLCTNLPFVALPVTSLETLRTSPSRSRCGTVDVVYGRDRCSTVDLMYSRDKSVIVIKPLNNTTQSESLL